MFTRCFNKAAGRVGWRRSDLREEVVSMRNGLKAAVVAAFATLAMASVPAAAQEAAFALKLSDHKFEPSTLEVKAGEKIKLTITNDQKQAAEFESHDFNREKIIPAGATVTVVVGPLNPGTYGFFDDFHKDTKGTIVAK